MSRLRFFRSQSNSSNVNGSAPFTLPEKKDIAPRDGIDGEDWSNGKTRETERLWGLENFGNTCYCNSVLQALYSCQPFRQFVESYPNAPPPMSALGPPPGTADVPNSPSLPSSPLAVTRNNPFDSPNGSTPALGTSADKRGWKGLGRRPTSSSSSAPSLATIQQGLPAKAPPAAAPSTSLPLVPLPAPDPNQPPPSVFETIQTLFAHLTYSPPHQPLAPRKDAKKEENAQTASLLPSDGPQPSLTTSSNPNVPQGPPLLASLPPPSAPRGGGPFQAGTLGRGVVRPEDLLKTVKRENDMFRGMSQQDAHEFLGWLLNRIAEEVEMVDRSLRSSGQPAVEDKGLGKTFVQNLFEGTLTNETRCLCCETTSSRDESFLDLSIDIEQHTSVTACLRGFSASEMLCQKNKFFCDSCCGLQEAEKRMKIKHLPNILALHLKRFKYQETLGRYTKLFYRVPFPIQLRLPNTSDGSEDPDRLYELFAVVVHIGNGPHHGHYVCIVRSGGRWVMCDDENVEPIEDDDIFRYFGDYPSGAGYVLFYQAVDLDLAKLGLKIPEAPAPAPTAASGPVEDLIEVDEPTSPTQPQQTSPKIPLKVDIPTTPAQAPPSSPKAPSTISSTPSQSQPSLSGSMLLSQNGNRTPSVERQLGFPTQASTPTSAKSKEKESKWYQRKGKDKEADRGRGAAATPVKISSGAVTPSSTPSAPTRQTTSTTLSSVGTGQTGSTFGINVPSAEGLAESVPAASRTDMGQSPSATTAMSSSVMSNFSAASASTNTSGSVSASANPPVSYTSQSSLGRKPSARGGRDRTVSASSQASTGSGYGGGGSLGRRLSGIGSGKSLLGRSGSLMKLGLGKKDKNGGSKGAGQEGIEEEMRKEEEREGLLS